MLKYCLKYYLRATSTSISLKQNFCALPNKLLVPASYRLDTDEAKEARGVIAYYFMQFIKQYQFVNYLSTKQSLRYQLLSEKLFYEYMLRNIQSLNQLVKSLDDLQAILPIQHYRQVASAFKIGQGAHIDIQIYSQQQIKNARNKNGKVTLNPTAVTTLYFNYLSNRTNDIISGEKGTGKSFSIIGFDYLSSIFLEYHQNLFSKQLIPTKNIKFQIAKFTPKICYVTMQGDLKPIHYFQQILSQYEYILGQDQYQKQKKVLFTKSVTLSDLSVLLRKISQYCREKHINNTIVLDEANHMFQAIKTYKKVKDLDREKYDVASHNNNKETNHKKSMHSDSFKAFKFCNQLINLFVADATTKFDNIIFSSSQSFEHKNIEYAFQEILQDFWFIKFFGKLKILDNKIKTRYAKFLSLPQGQIQLYNCLWFQIERFIELKGINKSTQVPIEELTAQYRAAFQEAFKLNELDAVQVLKSYQIPSNLKIWKNEVRHLHIQQYFTDLTNKSLNCNEKSDSSAKTFSQFSLSPTVAQLNTFKEEVIQVKQAIQSFRRKFIIKDLKEYLLRGIELREASQRIHYIERLQSEVNFISKPDQAYHNYEFKNLSSDKKAEFIEKIGFGIYNQSNDSLSFAIERQSFIGILEQLTFTKEYTYIKMNKTLQFVGHCRGGSEKAISKKIFNNFLNYLFKSQLFTISLNYRQKLQDNQQGEFRGKVIRSQGIRGFTRILTDEQYQEYIKQQQATVKQHSQSYSIRNKLPTIYTKTDHPISHSQLKKQFINLIQLSTGQEFKDYYYLAIPMTYLTEDRSSFIPCNNQAVYDNILVKKRQNLEFIFIDWKIDQFINKKVDESLEKYCQKVKTFLLGLKQIVQYQGKVRCTMIVAEHQYKVSQYFAYDHIQGDWHISIRGASFNQNLPFETKDDMLNKMSDIFKKIYQFSKTNQEQHQQFQKLNNANKNIQQADKK